MHKQAKCCCSLTIPQPFLDCMQWPKRLNAPLSEVDPELVDIIEKEKNRQWKVRVQGAYRNLT